MNKIHYYQNNKMNQAYQNNQAKKKKVLKSNKNK